MLSRRLMSSCIQYNLTQPCTKSQKFRYSSKIVMRPPFVCLRLYSTFKNVKGQDFYHKHSPKHSRLIFKRMNVSVANNGAMTSSTSTNPNVNKYMKKSIKYLVMLEDRGCEESLIEEMLSDAAIFYNLPISHIQASYDTLLLNGCNVEEIFENFQLLACHPDDLETQISRLESKSLPGMAFLLYKAIKSNAKDVPPVHRKSADVLIKNSHRTKLGYFARLLHCSKRQFLEVAQTVPGLLHEDVLKFTNAVVFLEAAGLERHEVIDYLVKISRSVRGIGICQFYDKFMKEFRDLGFPPQIILDCCILHHTLGLPDSLLTFYRKYPVVIKQVLDPKCPQDPESVLSQDDISKLSAALPNDVHPFIWIPKIYEMVKAGIPLKDIMSNMDLIDSFHQKVINKISPLLSPYITFQDIKKLIKKSETQIEDLAAGKEKLLKSGISPDKIEYKLMSDYLSTPHFVMENHKDPILYLAKLLNTSEKNIIENIDLSRRNLLKLISKLEYLTTEGVIVDNMLDNPYLLVNFSIERLKVGCSKLKKDGVVQPTVQQVCSCIMNNTTACVDNFKEGDLKIKGAAILDIEVKDAHRIHSTAKMLDKTVEWIEGSKVTTLKVEYLLSEGVCRKEILENYYVLARFRLESLMSTVASLKQLGQPITMKGIYRVSHVRSPTMNVLLHRQKEFKNLGVDTKNIPLRVLLQPKQVHTDLVDALKKNGQFVKMLQSTASPEKALGSIMNKPADDIAESFKDLNIWRMIPKVICLLENNVILDGLLFQTAPIINIGLRRMETVIKKFKNMGIDHVSVGQILSFVKYRQVVQTSIHHTDKVTLKKILHLEGQGHELDNLAKILRNTKMDIVETNLKLLKSYGPETEDVRKNAWLLTLDTDVLTEYLQRDELKDFLYSKPEASKLLNMVQYLVEYDQNFMFYQS